MSGSEAQKYNTAKITVTNAGTMTTVSTSARSTDADSLNAYYNAVMSKLGSDSQSVDNKADAQDDLITQITNWRSSTTGTRN